MMSNWDTPPIIKLALRSQLLKARLEHIALRKKLENAKHLLEIETRKLKENKPRG